MSTALPQTSQTSELGRFIEQNEQEIISAITAALGLEGPWALLVGWIIGWILDECEDPWAKNRDFRNQLDQANRLALEGRITPVQSRPMPAIEEDTLREVTVSVQASWDGSKVAAAPLVIPWDQTVTVSYALSGHAASPCHQDVAIVQILGVDGGTLKSFFRKEAEGVARLVHPEPAKDASQTTVNLPAGGYVLQAAVSGDYSSARLSVTYQTAQIRQEVSPLVWVGAAIVLLALRQQRRRT